jgi:hypothetical protein
MRITPMGWIWKIIRKSYREVPNPETQAVSRLWRVSQRTHLIELLPHVPIASALRKMDTGDNKAESIRKVYAHPLKDTEDYAKEHLRHSAKRFI